MQIVEIIERWSSNEGKPYKGRLIDYDSYVPGNLSCMCAQGQVLHAVAGWSPEKLRDTAQADADIATAKLLNISRAHAVLLRNTNDKIDGAPAIVLTDPGKVLGDKWSKLLDFWAYIDTLAAKDWRRVVAARDAAWAAAGAAARDAAWAAAWDAARDAARDAAGEIQGAEILKRNGRALFFLPMFGFASPDEIPARSADYGVPA